MQTHHGKMVRKKCKRRLPALIVHVVNRLCARLETCTSLSNPWCYRTMMIDDLQSYRTDTQTASKMRLHGSKNPPAHGSLGRSSAIFSDFLEKVVSSARTADPLKRESCR